MARLLLIEDDRALREGIVMTLESPEMEIIQAETIGQGREIVGKTQLDLILLDVNLPDGDGFEFCGELRQSSDVPVIFLTAKDMELDIVRGLEMGGDDYVTKPFSLMVLRARVRTVLRRKGAMGQGKSSVFYSDDLKLDFDSMVFTKGREDVTLSRIEQKLLKLLVMNQGRTLSRETLLDKVWGTEFVDDHVLPVTIKRLRDKLGTKQIKSIYGIGYVWEKKTEEA